MNRSTLNSTIWRFAHLTLKLDDEAYRNVIREVTTNKERVSLCTDQEAELVYAALKRFYNSGGRPPTQKANAPQHRFIPRLMEHLGWGWPQTAAFCERITGKKNTRDCDSAELVKIAQGMIAMIEQNHRSGRRVLTDFQLSEFRKYTRHQSKEAA